jgi:hypothetical protein
MATHTISATITVEITNPSALAAVSAISGGTGGDERAQVQAAVNAGLRELPSIAQRYGFRVTESSATVE